MCLKKKQGINITALYSTRSWYYIEYRWHVDFEKKYRMATEAAYRPCECFFNISFLSRINWICVCSCRDKWTDCLQSAYNIWARIHQCSSCTPKRDRRTSTIWNSRFTTFGYARVRDRHTLERTWRWQRERKECQKNLSGLNIDNNSNSKIWKPAVDTSKHWCERSIVSFISFPLERDGDPAGETEQVYIDVMATVTSFVNLTVYGANGRFFFFSVALREFVIVGSRPAFTKNLDAINPWRS